jgi:hypothetical protein
MTHNSPEFLASATSGAAMQRPPGIAPPRAAMTRASPASAVTGAPPRAPLPHDREDFCLDVNNSFYKHQNPSRSWSAARWWGAIMVGGLVVAQLGTRGARRVGLPRRVFRLNG